MREPGGVEAKALRVWTREWVRDVEAAKRGDMGPLIKALRSGRPLGLYPQVEGYVRDTLAGLLSGEFKRSRGRTKLSKGDVLCRQFDQACLIIDIDRLHLEMIRKRAKHPQQEACDQYAKQRGNITGRSVLRNYRKAMRDIDALEKAQETMEQEERLFPGDVPLADIGKRYARPGKR